MSGINFADKTFDHTDLIRVADVSRLIGYSRASIINWTLGRGRGSRVKLPCYLMFDGSVPVISRTELAEWMIETREDASDAHAENAESKVNNKGE